MERQILGSEEPPSFVRDWLIPWYTNTAVWALTVTAVVANRTIENPALLIGPLPKSESEAFLTLADSRTVLWPLAAVVVLGLVTWLLSLRPLRTRKGRKTPEYLLKQFVDELRSFALNAASLSAIACYYASSDLLLGSALACWATWAVLQRSWLKKHGRSPLDA